MCGRFTLTHSPAEVADRFGLPSVELFPPRYNIAPTQPVQIIIGGQDMRPESYRPGRQAMLARWGLIPAWCKNPTEIPLLYNARAESAAGRNAFRAALTYRRCLVPASGFYEWKNRPGAPSLPHLIRPADGGMMGLAGIMETYLSADGSEIDTLAILTCAAGKRLQPVHSRQPVVIARRNEDMWLDCHSFPPDRVIRLMEAGDDADWHVTVISDKVNAVANVGPDIQAPRPPDAADGQGSLPL